MPELSCYKLAFKSGLHLGVQDVDLETSGAVVPSDTLFAALMDAGRRAGISPDGWIAPFTQEADRALGTRSIPFALTSAMPYAGRVRFYPAPTDLTRVFSQQQLRTRRKDIKRIRFVSEAIFGAVLAGRCLDSRLFPADPQAPVADGLVLQGGSLWMTNDEVAFLPKSFQLANGRRHALRRRRVYHVAMMPRVTVQRTGAATDPFRVGRARFADECGLWFGVDWRAPKASVQEGLVYRDAFDRALSLLADDGIGGERSAGYGSFTWSVMKEPLVFPDAEPGGAALLLGRYHPANGELPIALASQGAAYNLVSVGGWLRTWDAPAERRRRLWMIEIGSTVRVPPLGLMGDVVDLRPLHAPTTPPFPHPVWRSGLACGVGVKEIAHA